VLPALDLALVLEHLAVGQRVVLVAALVADGVVVVADPHQADAMALDVEAACLARHELVLGAQAKAGEVRHG
jgi:hypothetical protein